MQTDIFVFDHDALRLQWFGYVKVLFHIDSRCTQSGSQLFFLPIGCKRDTGRRTYINAGIALDTTGFRENGLYVAIQTALCLLETEILIETEFDFNLPILERFLLVFVRNLIPHIVYDLAVIHPLMDTHLLHDEIGCGFEAILHLLAAGAKMMYGNTAIFYICERCDAID